MTDPTDLERLEQIKHIVVLMMENRSFDQMLGYLKRDGMPDVDGLTGKEENHDDAGNRYPVFEYGTSETVFHPDQDPSGKILDPCHGVDCVAEQLADHNAGFVKNFLATRKDQNGHSLELSEHYRGLVMGYYSAKHLPVYDHLARNFCVCDAWHASIPGDTWPNRVYSLAGRPAEHVGLQIGLLDRALGAIGQKDLSLLGKLKGAPIFNNQAFTRHLLDGQWRWYSHDPATLRAVDPMYRRVLDLKRDNFGYFNRKRIAIDTQAAEFAIVGHDSFLDDAARGELRDVSWIDPNFIDLSVLEAASNDDHPPSDVLAGQALALEVYEALVNSPNWQDTLLVITYDEHGGFFDHVAPPPVSDESPYPTLGVRVPALVIGPRVKPFACHEVFDHATLIKTILLRFAAEREQAVASMGQRVGGASHLGLTLQDKPRTDLPNHGSLKQKMDQWRQDARRRRRATPGGASEAADGAGQKLAPHDFQEHFMQFALAMRHQVLPPGQP